MKSAHSHHRIASLAGQLGGQAILVAAKENKRQGMIVVKHSMVMCMCCMMNMPVAGAPEVLL